MTHRIANPSREARAIAPAPARRPASDRIADTLIGIFLVVAVLAAAGAAHGQSLWGVRLGHPIEEALLQFPQAKISHYPEQNLVYYFLEFDTGTTLRVTGVGWDQEICYIDVQWGGSERDAALAAPGFRFGETTLADIRERLGSGGFLYDGGPEAYMEDGAARTYNYYDLDGYESLLVVQTGFSAEAWDRDPETLDDALAAGTLRGLSVTWRSYAEWMYGAGRSSGGPTPVVERVKW